MKNTYNSGIAAHYYDATVILPDHFDLHYDYQHPRSYTALLGDQAGHAIIPEQKVRVVVDHDTTGTGTFGTGDIVCKCR